MTPGRGGPGGSPVGPDWVVFSDLDGCLLDRETYAWEPARPALALLRERGVPLVLCSSKTQAEVEVHRAELDLRDPFIVENGGAILIPRGYFPPPLSGAEPDGPYLRVALGVPYARLTEALRGMERATGLRLRGFAEMGPEEVARLTGLGLAAARRARARQYDEPFVADLGPAEERRVAEEACRRGLALVRGGRLYHLTGGNTKGLAVGRLMALYRAISPRAASVGLGDGANDLPLLERVDVPVVIPRGPADVEPALRGRPWRVAPAPGPAGWNAALQALLAGGAAAPGGTGR